MSQLIQSPFGPSTDGEPIAPLAPIAGGQRIVAIDVLRGVVLLGILVMNVTFMGWPEAWAMDALRYRDSTAMQQGLWFFADVFVSMKMMSIFSLLFGGGIVMVADRAIAAGRSPAALHYKRMAWLLAIGLVHLFLMWYGDILVLYALVGSVVYLLRRLPAVWLVGIGALLLIFTMAIWLGLAGLLALFEQHDPAGYAQLERDESEAIAVEIAAYRGGPLSQLLHRVPSALAVILFVGPILYYWWAGGMMLLGMAAMKTRLILGQLSAKVYLTMLLIGVFAGLPLASGLAWLKLDAEPGDMLDAVLFQSAHFPLTLLVACGWVGGVLLLCKTAWFSQISHPLASVGRMALTNYLGQTLVVTFIFYGHGLGYFAQLDRPAMMLIVLGVWAVQLIASPIWLRYFRYGPVEWLWRSLTYARLQPMRKRTVLV